MGGLQYGPSSLAIFKGTLREGGVLLHEFGHLIGLVKTGPGQDPKHRHHCPAEACVMYYTVGSAYADFDQACRDRIAKLIAKRGVALP